MEGRWFVQLLLRIFRSMSATIECEYLLWKGYFDFDLDFQRLLNNFVSRVPLTRIRSSVFFLLYVYLRYSFVSIMSSTRVVIWFSPRCISTMPNVLFYKLRFPWICCLTCKQSFHSISYILRYTVSKNWGKKQIDYFFFRNWTFYLVSSIIIYEINFTATFETRPESSNVVDLDQLS